MAQLISHTIPEAYSSTRARTADRGCSPNDSYHGCLPLVKVANDGYIDMLKIPIRQRAAEVDPSPGRALASVC